MQQWLMDLFNTIFIKLEANSLSERDMNYIDCMNQAGKDALRLANVISCWSTNQMTNCLLKLQQSDGLAH